MADPKHIIVGTAGHIDHGKTSLVRALTGIDADRWDEEKRRGITIDLGFAQLELSDDLRLGFVDVPGHERFIKNMLAGVGGIDVVLMVIAADESVMPQTREHFDICRLLGIRRGITVLTKADLVDEDILDLVKLEVDEYVEGSFLESAPMIAVSSETGEGLDELRSALLDAGREIDAKTVQGFARLPIDRVFSMKGFGTVVTGTLTSGKLTTEAEVEIQPGGGRGRIRSVQVHGDKAGAATAGQRTAINISGVDKDDLRRGLTLVEPGLFRSTKQFDAHLELLPSAKALKHGAPVHLHAGTAEAVGRVYLLEREGSKPALAAGSQGFVQLRLDADVFALPGDRFILRQFSPLITIAGGVVLDPMAPRHRQKDNWRPLLEAMHAGSQADKLEALAECYPHGVGVVELIARSGRPAEELSAIAESSSSVTVIRREPLWIASTTAIADGERRLLEALAAFHKKNPLHPGASTEAIRSSELSEVPEVFASYLIAKLLSAKKIQIDGELIRLAGHRIVMQADEQEARNKMLTGFESAGLKVPGLKEFLPTLKIDAARSRRILQTLLREGLLVKVTDELVFHRDALSGLKKSLSPLRGKEISVPEFKELAGVSRKYAIPLLEYFDKQKVTRRSGNVRIVV